MVLCNRVHVCGIRGTNRVALLLLGDAPAIVNAGRTEAYQEDVEMNNKIFTHIRQTLFFASTILSYLGYRIAQWEDIGGSWCLHLFGSYLYPVLQASVWRSPGALTIWEPFFTSATVVLLTVVTRSYWRWTSSQPGELGNNSQGFTWMQPMVSSVFCAMKFSSPAAWMWSGRGAFWDDQPVTFLPTTSTSLVGSASGHMRLRQSRTYSVRPKTSGYMLRVATLNGFRRLSPTLYGPRASGVG